MIKNLSFAALMLAWLVTPESLRLVGVGTGHWGSTYLLALILGAGIALICVRRIHAPSLRSIGLYSDADVLKTLLGESGALYLLISGRVPFLLFGSTGLLVTAGFTFNEVFVYWFPNFLFASLLLLCVALLNLSSERTVLLAQLAFVSVALTGMLVLIVAGIFKEPAVVDEASLGTTGATFSLLGMGVISYLGFDFHRAEHGRKIGIGVIVFGLVILCGYAFVAAQYVSGTRLVESTVSHMLVAKGIGGDQGRYIMGGVVISSVLACVNALFLVTRRIFSSDFVIPARGRRRGAWLVTVLFGVIIGVMMLSGVAGEDILEAKITGSIVLWLMYLSVRTVVSGHILLQAGYSSGRPGLISALVLLFIALLMVLTNPEMIYITAFLFMVLFGAALLVFLRSVVGKLASQL